MENASKALIIAGSILISILIIGIGMWVYQSIQGTIAEGVNQMSAQEKQMFNQQFLQYEGQRVNGANVRALISKVNNNNSQLEDENDPKWVSITYPSGTTAATINTARTYTVTVTDDDGDGLMDLVTIGLVTN